MIPADGFAYFYTQTPWVPRCSHSYSYVVWDYNDGQFGFCGFCFLAGFFQAEVPKRLHEYELLADNGNPEMSPQFLRLLEGQLGLEPPIPGQNLQHYRLARKQLRRQPTREFPVTRALWDMMGYQPPLAKPLVRSLLGVPDEVIMKEAGLSAYQFHSLMAKAIRLAMRNMRK